MHVGRSISGYLSLVSSTSSASSEPSVSVVVPTKNRPVETARMLQSLRAQATMPLEVMVIDQSTVPYPLEEFAGLLHVHDPHIGGASAARNHGAQLARGDIVLFLDDDVVLESDCIRAVSHAFAARPDLVGAQCAIHNPWDDAPAALYDLSTLVFERGFFNARPRRRGREEIPRLIDGLASAYRREFLQHERFDEALPGYSLAEDWDLTKRAARYGALTTIPAARVRHEHAQTNRLDATAYAKLRRTNILYLYDKLDAARDPRNRLWKQWWLLGESLRGLRTRLRSYANTGTRRM
jgi:glucosyl-dolichyl phosphate glucuronosyltransferase